MTIGRPEMRLCSLFVLVHLLCVASDKIVPQNDPENYYSMVELVCRHGYHIQEYTVLTPDGYYLTLFRIPGEKRLPAIPKKENHYRFVHRNFHPDFSDCYRESTNVTFKGPPILLVHGLGSASDCWVLQGPKYDLAFLLADHGYDVWLANVRGNFYSKGHKTLKVTSKAFWDYSFDEHGFHDIPSTVDFVLKLTGYKNLLYIGHSMGTTMFFVMTSARPEYNQKVALFVGLTPVAQIRWPSFNPRQQALLNFARLLIRSYLNNGIYQFFPRSNVSSYVTKEFCTKASPRWIQDLCYDISFFFVGVNTRLFSREKLAVLLCHGFSGASVKTWAHFSQLLDAPCFQAFDYGPKENLRRYGQEKPFEYPLWKITTPAAFYYSDGDYISVIKDVEHLKTLLPNLVKSYYIEQISHMDFIWAVNATEMVFEDVLAILEEYKHKVQ